MNKKLFVLSGLALTLAPAVAFAQVGFTGATPATCEVPGASNTLFTLMCKVGQLLNGVIPILIALAILYFIWGVVSFVIADDEEAKSKGRDRIIYGVIGLAVIVGVWGLVRILNNTFGLNNNASFGLPTVPIVLPSTSTTTN